MRLVNPTPCYLRGSSLMVLQLLNHCKFIYSHFQVKFAELTLDTYRMIQCLEWEPSGSFYQKPVVKSNENGGSIDHSAASGLINMNLTADMTDPTLPSNPRKAALYRPSVTHLIAVSFPVFDEAV